MFLSRWKLMAGVLGVSLGGLAAVTGQCPKSDSAKQTRRQSELPNGFEIPTIPPAPSAGSPSAKPTTAPLPSSLPLPAAPALPAPVELPPAPPAAELPSLPVPVSAPLPAKVPAPPLSTPAIPASPVIPASGTETKPLLPPTADPMTKPTPPATTSAPAFPDLPQPKASQPPSDPVIEQPVVKAPVIDAPPVQKAVASKYRILLRVGEGEPTFEVKCGDDLILKVICEKIDIKSPEKGSGPSAVKASGKVRFVGFGAEGICEELSFLAGTGEVTMTGAVKIQVKDKLGRTESELSTETMKYRIDPSATFTGGKP